MAEITPGHWTCNLKTGVVRGPNGEIVAWVRQQPDGPFGINPANVRAISRLPELVEALDDTVCLLESLPVGEAFDQVQEQLTQARNIIAEARGNAPQDR